MPNKAGSFYNLSGGLNTEASLLDFPAGFSVDERNYTIERDGSRRRRKGLELEAGGSEIDISATPPGGSAYSVHKWRNAGNIPQNDYIVVQTGRYLRFYVDEHPVSTSALASYVDLENFRLISSPIADVAASVVDAASGRGHLFVVGKHLTPFYIELDTSVSPNLITAYPIDIKERDFEGAQDGITDVTTPATAVASHTYNLMNRGWTSDMISSFVSSQSHQPAKNMIPWLGLQRGLTPSNYYNEDGVRTFAPNKLVSELFQDATAPLGHFIRNPFDTTRLAIPGAPVAYNITTWSISGTGSGPQTITITTASAHGLAAGDYVTIVGNLAYYLGYNPPDTQRSYTFNGYRHVDAVPTTTTFTITLSGPSYFDNWNSGQYAQLGTVYTSAVENPEGYNSTSRPTATSFFAGRVFYAGTPFKHLATRIFYSQVVETDTQYGKCYQVADPTDERISDIVPTDGGVINIPEANNVIKLLPYGASLLIFASNGVWQLGPGGDGYFSGTSYSVRKITEIGATNPRAIVVAEGIPIYWGYSDIFAIVQDPNTGFLVTQNLSNTKINKFYNDIPHDFKFTSAGVYDDKSKTVVWLYGEPYTSALLYDMKFQAFVPYTFGVVGMGELRELLCLTPFPDGEIPKVRYITTNTVATSLTFNTLTDSTFADIGSAEEPAYLLTAYDSAGDPQPHQQAPYITVFSRKTETGYTVSGDSYTPIGASSTKMQARWDWADASIAGKWGMPQEVYRRARLYIPSDPSTDTFADGAPLLVTQNMVRGRGRTLQLKFTAGQGKDSWIQGFKVYYTKNRII